jgi:photosystem II stability/assembly factor-like uncharacterized protein
MRFSKRFLQLCVLAVAAMMFSQTCSSQIYEWRKVFGGPGFTVAINPLNPNSIYAETFTAKLYVSRDLGANWTFLGSPGISQIRQILVHPNDTLTIFCVNETGGLRRTTDEGATWSNVLSPYGIDGESVTYDPVHPDTMFAGSFGPGIVYKSIDRGVTWDSLGSVNSFLCALAVRPDSTNIMYCGSGGGRISKSTDYGVTWRLVRSSPTAAEIPKIEINQANPLIAYASVNGGFIDSLSNVLRTTDGGENWLYTSLKSDATWSLAIDQSNPDIVYTGVFGLTPANVYKTTDEGSTWSIMTSLLLNNTYSWSLKVSPMNPDVVWQSCGFFSNLNGGIYKWSGSQTGIRGAILDLTTNDTITNGFIRIPLYFDSTNLAKSHGTYSVGYFPNDISSPYAQIQAYPYPATELTLSFINDSITTQPIYLQKLATASISGVVRDSATHQPLQATVRLFVRTILSHTIITINTDSIGTYSFDSLYITSAPIVQYDSVRIDPVFPYAALTIKGFTLSASGLNFASAHNIGDILVVQGSGSQGYSPFFSGAIDQSGSSSVSWNTNLSGIPKLSSATQFNKKLVVYYSGDNHSPLLPGETDSLKACLDAGCKLLITGQDILEMNDNLPFFKDFLGIQFGGGGLLTVRGRADEIFGDNTFSMNYVTSAQDQTSPDRIGIINQGANIQTLINNGGNGHSGISAVRIIPLGTSSKVIFMGFGLEGVNTPEERAYIMRKSLDDLLIPSTSFALGATHQQGWNLVSAPLTLDDPHVTVVYPSASSNLFSYDGVYIQNDTFQIGKGYWLKFDTTGQLIMVGQLMESDTINVHPGWNIIGSVSKPVATNSILTVPDSMITSEFFDYSGSGYTLADTIVPGGGYWVKVSQAGSLILSSTPESHAPNKVRMRLKGELPPPPPDGAVGKQTDIPQTFALYQNYPNPFNPTTDIRFRIAKYGFVSLKVFDVIGREVATLVNEVKQPGEYTVSWDAGKFPSGIYFYRLSSGIFSDVKKLVLLK